MLGNEIADPDGVEGPPATVPGLGLLDLTTTFSAAKVLRRHRPAGYEIHHGHVTGDLVAGTVTGTMIHGALEDDSHRAAYLSATLGVTSRASFPQARERRLDLLGDLVEEHLDIEALLRLAREGMA
jgi:adenosylcobyric acid synthase